MDQTRLFTSSLGVRVVTSMQGSVVGLVGVAQTNRTATVSTPTAALQVVVSPNEELAVSGAGGGKLVTTCVRAAPFVPPFS